MAPQVFIFMGGSGSGKGTQAKLLKEYLEKSDERKVLYISTGDRFRELSKKETYTSGLVEKLMEEGGLAPAFLPVWAWTDFLIENYTGEEHVIMDGLARKEVEAPMLDSALEFYGIEHPHIVYIDVSKEWSRKRLLERGRDDDNPEEIEKRLSWFYKDSMKSIEYFKNHEKTTFHKINGEQTIEEVYKDVVKALNLN